MHSTKVLTNYAAPEQAILDGIDMVLDEAGLGYGNLDILIHGTPVGMHGADPNESVVPWDLLQPGQVVFDMVYRPKWTRLLRDALALECTVIHGLEMLLYQAALQFETWTGIPAPIDVMREALENKLEQDQC
mgnify:CR=1 FL=1